MGNALYISYSMQAAQATQTIRKKEKNVSPKEQAKVVMWGESQSNVMEDGNVFVTKQKGLFIYIKL